LPLPIVLGLSLDSRRSRYSGRGSHPNPHKPSVFQITRHAAIEKIPVAVAADMVSDCGNVAVHEVG